MPQRNRRRRARSLVLRGLASLRRRKPRNLGILAQVKDTLRQAGPKPVGQHPGNASTPQGRRYGRDVEIDRWLAGTPGFVLVRGRAGWQQQRDCC